jgi:hypothetical protein
MSERLSERAWSRVLDHLRALYPAKTAEHVAGATGLSPARVAKWFARGSRADFGALLALLDRFGPPLLAALWGEAVPPWLAAAAAEAEAAAIEEEITTRRNRLAALRRGDRPTI